TGRARSPPSLIGGGAPCPPTPALGERAVWSSAREEPPRRGASEESIGSGGAGGNEGPPAGPGAGAGSAAGCSSTLRSPDEAQPPVAAGVARRARDTSRRARGGAAPGEATAPVARRRFEPGVGEC